MSDTTVTNQIDIKNSQQNGIEHVKGEKKRSQQETNLLASAYMQIYKAVENNQQTANLEAKQVQAQAAAQNDQIDQLAKMNYFTLSKSMLNPQVATKGPGGGGWLESAKCTLGNLGMSILKPVQSALQTANSRESRPGWERTLEPTGTLSKSQIQANKQSAIKQNIAVVGDKNQKISGERSVLQGKQNDLQQTSQIIETKVNTEVNMTQQNISIFSNILSILSSLSKSISQI